METRKCLGWATFPLPRYVFGQRLQYDPVNRFAYESATRDVFEYGHWLEIPMIKFLFLGDAVEVPQIHIICIFMD